jgi:abortive infection bacteriophage resistance protein
MKTYKKKPLLYTEQLALWQSRGLLVENEIKAENHLKEISYFRLSSYALPFQATKDKFNTGTTFQEILNLYQFDRDLRIIVLEAIERIEIAIRAQVIYTLAHKYKDSHWQDNVSIFNPAKVDSRTGKIRDVFADTQSAIAKHLGQKHPEVFISHYKSKYNDPYNPPSWMSLELLTIGELSRLYTALRQNSDRQAIADFFHLPHTVFTSWLHTFVYVRNICAHHSRLWNREFAIKPDVLQNPRLPWIQPAFNTNNHRTFYMLFILKYLLASANPEYNFKEKLENLFLKYPKVPIQFMGIPTSDGSSLIDWKNEKIWS